MVQKFMDTVSKKSMALKGQQTNVQNGCAKLAETERQLFQMRSEMEKYSALLREKDQLANDKLNVVVENQREAMLRKNAVEKVTKALIHQDEEIKKRTLLVQEQLDLATPALLAAKDGVKNIKKAQFDEVKALTTPPNVVRLVMELVVVLIGESQTDWMSIRRVLRGEDFLNSILNYDPKFLSQEQLHDVQSRYLNNSDLNQTAVDRGSKACAPLYQWARNQINYSSILFKLEPLHKEIHDLQIQADELKVQQAATLHEVNELNKAILNYKDEYAVLVREHSQVKVEMDAAAEKTARAEALLFSLMGERERWRVTSESFEYEQSALIGDALLSASFLTFAGIFDQASRAILSKQWSKVLTLLRIPFRKNYDPVSFLPSPSSVAFWLQCGLSNDSISIQNAVIMEHFSRYPLLIDPSGQAESFIIRKYSDSKISSSSFLDPNYLKHIATSIRFGAPILLHDAEFFDPVLNSVLNKEVQRSNGRNLVRMGNDEIDFSPKFVLILLTKDPLARFPPDLCSRVTMINFSVTASSLEAQILGKLLKSERPDVEHRRIEMKRLRSEQILQLRGLEDSILHKIGSLRGAILDDDSFLLTLEQIKQKATEIEHQVAASEEVLAETAKVMQEFKPLARIISAIYQSLIQLSDVSSLYQFSLLFFFEVLETALALPIELNTPRLPSLAFLFIREVSRQTMRALKFHDQILFALNLAVISLQDAKEKVISSEEMRVLTTGMPLGNVPGNSRNYIQTHFVDAFPGLTNSNSVAQGLVALHSLKVFAYLPASLARVHSHGGGWIGFLNGEDVNAMPGDWLPEPVVSCARAAFLKLLVIRCLHPSLVIMGVDVVIDCVFGQKLRWRDDGQPHLHQLVTVEMKSFSPLLMCCEKGRDASTNVVHLAAQESKQLHQLSMGAAENYVEAEQLVCRHAESGSWVLLRNVHLCIEWLISFEKMLSTLHYHNDFRLFLTSDIVETLPKELLSRSKVILFEASTGIKANIRRFLGNIPVEKFNRASLIHIRIYALLGWLHAVVQERLLYIPLGWSKKYEFSDADSACFIKIIDAWVRYLYLYVQLCTLFTRTICS